LSSKPVQFRTNIGTWIPLERGVHLTKQYNCDQLLRAILDFQPDSKSPPLAPKHVAAPGSKAPRRTAQTLEASTSGMTTRSARRHLHDENSDIETLTERGSGDGSLPPTPSDVASSSSRTPSPIGTNADYDSGEAEDDSPLTNAVRKRKSQRLPRQSVDERRSSDPATYADQILEYFISDTNQVPQILISPPTDFDPNMAIDDDGHTPLHWASAMGRVRIVKLVLSAGADIFKVNKAGQTALMRSVMFANNYDVRKFPELYELLHKSTLNIDHSNRTVFHHIVDVAMTKGKTHAARYYMETVLNRLSDYPKELADIINFQDEDGETALTLAARCRSKRLVKLLLDHGADPKIQNRDGKSTEDYILEDERFRSSPVIPSRALSMSFRNAQAAYAPLNTQPMYAFAPANGDRPPLHHSVAAQRASTKCVNDMASMLDNLAASFDKELRDKERDMNQANALLANIQGEILESQRAVGHLQGQSQGLEQMTNKLKQLEEELYVKMGKRYRLGWEKWVKDEEEREKAIRDANQGLLVDPADGQGEGESLSSKGQKRKTDEIPDLLDLYTNVPSNAETLKQECEKMREDVGQYRKRRKTTFSDLVKFQAEAGTGGRMAEYRRLIGAGCGLPSSEVDNVLGILAEVCCVLPCMPGVVLT
jgi:transcription factor MBP1